MEPAELSVEPAELSVEPAEMEASEPTGLPEEQEQPELQTEPSVGSPVTSSVGGDQLRAVVTPRGSVTSTDLNARAGGGGINCTRNGRLVRKPDRYGV